ncbi:phenylacetate--CoA ligase family protein [Candidatus Woesearchaeota archaeon]|nr:phenylacetate--CoA ligase family protein [Candidatus Woesearchaeota archaeon]
MRFISQIYSKILLPARYLLEGDLRFLHYYRYKRNLRMDHNAIRKYQLDRLRKILRHAYDTTDYYREVFDKEGIDPDKIDSMDDLQKIPILTKKRIEDNLNRLKSHKKFKILTHHSGGSTGNKVTVFKDQRYFEISNAIWMRDLNQVGVEPGDKIAWIWGEIEPHKTPLKKAMDSIIPEVCKRSIRFNVFKYTDEELEEWIKNEFNKFKPDYMYGFAGMIYELAKLIEQRGLNIHQLKKIITTAESLNHREFIEKTFGCQVIDHYGATEIPSIAIENLNYVMHSSDDFIIIELDSKDNILITSLESYGMPLIRYQIGDVGMMNKRTKSGSNHPFSEFSIRIGRIYEILRNRKYEKISGGLIKELVEKSQLNIGEFQVVQQTIDTTDLNIVQSEKITRNDISAISKIIKKTLGCRNLNIKFTKKFPVESNGKKIAFKCNIEDKNHSKKKTLKGE